MPTHKIVIDLDVECEASDVDDIVADLEAWYAPGSGQETQNGTGWQTTAVLVIYDGLVEDA